MHVSYWSAAVCPLSEVEITVNSRSAMTDCHPCMTVISQILSILCSYIVVRYDLLCSRFACGQQVDYEGMSSLDKSKQFSVVNIMPQ